MSTIKAKNIKQTVIGGTTQPLKIGGIASDGSDAKISIDTNGNTTLNQVTGIKFPATQVPSTDANTLDDYEEGTFTPTVTFATTTGTITYVVQQGRYVKIGGLVTIFFKVTFSQTDSSGVIKLGGFPFGVIGSPSASGATYTSGLSSVTGTPIARADNTLTFSYLYQIVNGTALALYATNVILFTDIEFTMTYRAS